MLNEHQKCLKTSLCGAPGAVYFFSSFFGFFGVDPLKRTAQSVFVYLPCTSTDKKSFDSRFKNLRRGKLGDSLGAFRHGVLGEFTRQDETDRGLDFAGSHRRLLVVSGEARGFGGDLFKDVVDERVHDGHRLGGDTGVRVDLLEHLVDVDLVGFSLGLAATLLGARRLLLSRLLTGHCDRVYLSVSNCDEWGAAHRAFQRNLPRSNRGFFTLFTHTILSFNNTIRVSRNLIGSCMIDPIRNHGSQFENKCF